MKTYQASIGVRGDCLYCPLPLQIDSYWNCLVDCHHCCFRRLNRTWGQDLRPADPDEVRRKLERGLKNATPKSSLAYALRLRKTIRLGSKTDPYQPVERELRVSRRIQRHLIALDWSYVIQTRFTEGLIEDEGTVSRAQDRGLLTLLPVISPGAEVDWELFERKRTTPIEERLKSIRSWVRRGWKVGVNGEPFIPGFHTVKQFRDVIRRLKRVGVKSYNTYNLHLNDHVLKRLHKLGLDIERIWRENQDSSWRTTQVALCRTAADEGIVLGCPDFVNAPRHTPSLSNTCCGIDVPNPSLFNVHHWRRLLQQGHSEEQVLDQTWEGIGDMKQGSIVLSGDDDEHYTMKDVVESEKGFGLR